VFNSEVLMEHEGRLSGRAALRRLADFAQAREGQAAKKRAAWGVAVVGLLWGWLGSLANGVAGVLGWLGGHGAGSEPSAIVALGARAKALVATAATGVTAATVAAVPPVGDAAEWLFEPRYYVGGPAQERTPEDAIAAFARAHDWEQRGWDYAGDCSTATQGEPRRGLVCSGAVTPGRHGVPSVARGDRVYAVAPGWSDVHPYSFLVLRHDADGWVVRRELGG
jgi:hypothetical protein